jgi:hypothetical protein
MRFGSIRPFSLEELVVIPADTTTAFAAKIDFLAVFDTYIAMVKKVDPQSAATMPQGIGLVEAQLGLKIREEILVAW